MQFRFREYDEEKKAYNLITYTDIEDYDTMFKTLTFMKEHNCENSIEVNTKNLVEEIGDCYYIKEVSLCLGQGCGSQLIPHFVVDIEREY